MNSIFNYFRIIRPLNVILSGVATLIGSYLLHSTNYLLIFIMSIVVMIFCAAGNIINDLFDVETDKINHPNRPIIRLNSLKFNYSLIGILIFGLFITSLLSYIYFNFYSNLFLIFIFLLILFYTPFLKGIPLFGNIVISFILSSVFIFPSIILKGNFFELFHILLLTFFLTLIREIIKDVADIEGDKISQIHTFPIVYGVVYSKWLISILSLLLIGLSIYPYAMNIYNTTYLITLVLYVQIPLVSCIFYLWKYPNSQSCVVLTTTTKYITIGGVITILTTKLFA